MTRLLRNRWKAADRAGARDAWPWIASGLLDASTVIKAEQGLLAGIVAFATDNGGDISLRVWDSANDTTDGKETLGYVNITEAASGAMASLSCPSREGIEAEQGLYVEVVSGDCTFIVYYK
jgi:hypothetical protein